MHTLPNLPYAYDALEPYIDGQTMELHHSKHHQAYIDKLNGALSGTEWEDTPLEQMLQNLDTLPEDIRTVVRNNGGGHYNHSFFWQCMAPDMPETPTGAVLTGLEQDFGSFDAFKEQFEAAAVGRFGSGWAWLTKDSGGKLVVSSTPNQDSPIMEGVEPILGLDVWEHAYYLKYQNRRPEYISNWWHVVNWEFVSSRLD